MGEILNYTEGRSVLSSAQQRRQRHRLSSIMSYYEVCGQVLFSFVVVVVVVVVSTYL